MGMRCGAKLLLRSVALLTASLAGAADLLTLISALRAQDYLKAVTLARELKAHNALDPRLSMLEGMANEGLKNKAEALRNYRSALEIKPDYLPALKAEAQLEYAGGD